MWEHLFTKSCGAPMPYVTLQLCRDVYHCPPDALRRQDLRTVLEHLTCLSVEAQVHKSSSKTR